ncbi:MAG: helix-turn-helix domain-containing protein, partial [Halodesulfovibrio sp.]
YLHPANACPPQPQSTAPAQAAPPMTMEEIKCRAAQTALARHDGRRMAACRELGITKDTLRNLLKRCPDTSPRND